jgi:hypothetical protein
MIDSKAVNTHPTGPQPPNYAPGYPVSPDLNHQMSYQQPPPGQMPPPQMGYQQPPMQPGMPQGQKSAAQIGEEYRAQRTLYLFRGPCLWLTPSQYTQNVLREYMNQ